MTKKKTVTISLIVFVLVLPVVGYFGLDLYYRINNQDGEKNYKICQDIAPGIEQTELFGLLGEPVSEYKLKGNQWYNFNTTYIASGPITARIEDDFVVELRCDEDGPSTWKIKGK